MIRNRPTMSWSWLRLLLVLLVASIQVRPGAPIRLPQQNSCNFTSDSRHFGACSYLLSEVTGDRLEPHKSQLDAKLAELLARDGPDIRSNRANYDFRDVTLEMSQRAWALLEVRLKRALQTRVNLVRPAIEEVLERAKVSSQCSQSLLDTLASAQAMQSWALQLVNSWGSLPPAGLFEGTYTDLGSYHTCVNIARNPTIEHAHYCTLTYRPVMPSHKDYHIVLNKEPAALLNLFDVAPVEAASGGSFTREEKEEATRHVLSGLLEHSQYFHYVYFKLGSCWPIKCSPFDVKRVAKFLGWSNMLLNGPVKCFSHHEEDYEEPGSVAWNATSLAKLHISTADLNQGLFIWKPYYTSAQRVAYLILGFVLTSLLAFTLIDVVFFRCATSLRARRREQLLTNITTTSSDKQPQDKKLNCLEFAVASADHEPHLRDPTAIALCQQQQQQQQSAMMMQKPPAHNNDDITNELEPEQEERAAVACVHKFIKDMSIVTNWQQFFSLNQSQLKNDILCLNGLRCITMIWIIITHTLLYNDWGAFGRTKEIEKSIKTVATQPLFNGSYLVDTFFLMSGLLTAFSVFKNGSPTRFRSHVFLIGRWLRLTPQIFLVSMIYIVLPHLNNGPHWYQQVGEYSENCSTNWWINMLHLQAFYRTQFMCNFPTWWVSIDSYYHLFALLIVWVQLATSDSKWARWSVLLIMLAHAPLQAYHHFVKALPPNIFSTIPQTGIMWAEMTLSFYWRPYSHTIPFFVGFLTGCLLTPQTRFIETHLTSLKAAFLSTLTGLALLVQSYSTWWWVSGQLEYSKPVATIFHLSAQLVWALCFAWIIVACQKGFAGPLNRLLSSSCFIILGKASYMIYLTHFQIIFTSYGSQNLLIDPAPFQMIYLIMGNIVFSLIYGVLMCILIEFPLLKIQKRIMSYL